MLLAIKSLIGATVIGAGALVPVAMKKTEITSIVPKEFINAVKNSHTLKAVEKEVVANKTNSKVAKALKMLSDKKCQVMQNAKNLNNWFNSLYGCKLESSNKAEFYYLGSKDSLLNESDSSLIKKVTHVDYQRGWDGLNSHLELTLEGGQKLYWSIFSKSGWQHFKNVDLGEICKIETPKLGKDLLRCDLKNSGNSSSVSSYYFAIF